LVVWNIFYFDHILRIIIPTDYINFSEGLKPLSAGSTLFHSFSANSAVTPLRSINQVKLYTVIGTDI
jgi:hypothetical protein